MTERKLSGELRCLRVYLGESDKFQHKIVWKQILERARAVGISGCTVLGGRAGFGAGRRIHSDFPPEVMMDLPMLVELVDESDWLDKFLEDVKPMLLGALVTEERALVHHYQPGQPTTGTKES